MRWRIVIAAITTILLSNRSPAQSQTTVLIARVADARTGVPIAHAEVLLADLEKSGRTNDRGEARLADIPAGVHRVLVRQPGYGASDSTMSFDADTVTRVFLLQGAARVLDTVAVTDKNTSVALRDFEVRRSMGLGRFLVEDDLRREGTRDFALVAQSRLPGIRAVSGGDGRYRLASTRSQCGNSRALGEADSAVIGRAGGGGLRGTQGSGTSGARMEGSCASSTPCWMQVYLDGVKVNSDLGLVHTSQLYGVEYYSGTSMPVEYRTAGSACGVLLVWTRPH
jgi:hypothetical protein